jgi:trimeric autotransporter adhesin
MSDARMFRRADETIEQPGTARPPLSERQTDMGTHPRPTQRDSPAGRRRQLRRSIPAAGVALLSSLVLLALAGPALAAPSSMSDTTYVTNGTVNAITRSGNTIYLGGQFSVVGPRTGPFASLNATSGADDPTLPQVSGAGAAVYAVVSDGSGGEYIGGSFTHVGGIARIDVAHILANGTVDPNWDPSFGGGDDIYALALGSSPITGESLYMGGYFAGIDGTGRNNAAAVNATTGALLNWNPNLNGPVAALAVSGSTVYIGGQFSGSDSVNGTLTRNYLAAVDNASGAATGWNPSPSGDVDAITVSGSTIYVGGYFSSIGGQSRAYAAAVDASGSTDAWDPNPNDPVYALAVSGSTVYLGGIFTQLGASTRETLGAVDGTSGIATSWDPSPDGDVQSLAVSGTTVYVGGYFNSIAGGTRNDLAAVNADGTLDSFDPELSGDVAAVDAILPNGSNVIAGGDFSTADGVTRNNAAAINAADGTVTAWNPNADSGVNAILTSGNTVYLGGSFGTVNGGTARNYAAAVDATTGTVNGWNPDANAGVKALAISGNTIYLGGQFTEVGTFDVNYLAAVDATTGAPDTSWNPDPDGEIEALALSGSTLYIGGSFGTINGSLSQFNAAAVSTNGSGAVTAWNPDPNGYIDAIVPDGATVYLGGDFSTLAGVTSRKSLAAVDSEYGNANSWNPDTNGSVNAMALSGNTLYVGGSFTTVNGTVDVSNAAAIDATTGIATGWNPDPNNQVFAVYAAPDGTIYLGGSFTTFDLDSQAGFGSFSETPANSTPPVISGTPAAGQTLACSTGVWSGSTPQSYTYQWLRDGTAISGATGAGYAVAIGDRGQQLACTVTAANLAPTTASARSTAVDVPDVPAATIPVAFSGNDTVNDRNGTVRFSETASDAGTFRWLLTFKNGEYGVFDTGKHKRAHCKRGQIKLDGKCGPATIVYSQGSATAPNAGKVDFTAKPKVAGKAALAYALKHHKTLTMRATLTFSSSLGGAAVTQTRTLKITPKAPKHKKRMSARRAWASAGVGFGLVGEAVDGPVD